MALIDTVAIFVASLLIGTVAILAGVRLLVDSDAGVPNAAFTAVLGALAWAASSAVVDWLGIAEWIPLVGVVLMLFAWVAIVNWRYPGGWGTAGAIGFVAWIVAVAVVSGLSAVGLVTPDALGIPGI